jgi:hypothetical protein
MELDGQIGNRGRFGSECSQFAISCNQTARNGDLSNFLPGKPFIALLPIVRFAYSATTLCNNAAQPEVKLARSMRVSQGL